MLGSATQTRFTRNLVQIIRKGSRSRSFKTKAIMEKLFDAVFDKLDVNKGKIG